MADTEKEILRETIEKGLKGITPDKLKEILKKINEGKAVKRGGTVSRKRGKKIMHGYKAGGKV
jgi:hypothetical protein|tara:strand:+ start:51 stop:239 length:189 start_codon:yes stop_codon:yes gene_type:complete